MENVYTDKNGVRYWVEENDGPVTSYMVVAQAPGYPATEAVDDWFANYEDARQVAQDLAAQA